MNEKTLKNVMSELGKKRWAKYSKKEMMAHMVRMSKKGVTAKKLLNKAVKTPVDKLLAS